jgi:hypothetical protein
MSEFVRRLDLEKAVEEQYKIDVEVYHKVIDSDDYEVKITKGNLNALLHEHMKNGLTKYVILTTDKAITYKKYSEAEEDAIEYLKG